MRVTFEDILSTLCKFELSLYLLVAIVILSIGYLCLQEKSPRPRADPMSLSSSSGRTRTVESDCFICRGETRLGLETNCGHTFCGGCILEAWRQSSVFFTSFALVCPYCWPCKHHCCYQRITTLLPHFSEEETSSTELATVEERNNILREAKNYNNYFSGESRTIIEHFRDLPLYLRRLRHSLDKTYKLNVIFNIRINLLIFLFLVLSDLLLSWILFSFLVEDTLVLGVIIGIVHLVALIAVVTIVIEWN